MENKIAALSPIDKHNFESMALTWDLQQMMKPVIEQKLDCNKLGALSPNILMTKLEHASHTLSVNWHKCFIKFIVF